MRPFHIDFRLGHSPHNLLNTAFAILVVEHNLQSVSKVRFLEVFSSSDLSWSVSHPTNPYYIQKLFACRTETVLFEYLFRKTAAVRSCLHPTYCPVSLSPLFLQTSQETHNHHEARPLTFLQFSVLDDGASFIYLF